MLFSSLQYIRKNIFKFIKVKIPCHRIMSSSVNKDNEVIVIHNEDNKDLKITLRYISDEFKINRLFNFHRKSTENCSRVLTRISENITKKIARKTKGKGRPKDDTTSPVEVNLVHKDDGKPVDMEAVTCLEIIGSASSYYLRIGNLNYSFDINPPTLTSLELPKNNIMAGFLIRPSRLEVVNCNVNDTMLKWFRSKQMFETYGEARSRMHTLNWEEMGEGINIYTSNDDVSRLLKVVGTPCSGSNKGVESECISSTVVSPGPGTCPFERRHQSTKEILKKNFLRVVSYNILADTYADSDYSRTTLFPTCPAYALDIAYRKQLLIKEILGYNADLICLQEVDEKVFTRSLYPVLRHYGFDGVFKRKGNTSIAEGVATFYRRDKFTLEEKYSFMLGQELEINPLFSDLLTKVKGNSTLFENIAKRSTIVQISVLRRLASPSQIVVLGVTHLYFSPLADHIRLFQAGMCLTLIRQIMDITKAQNPNSEVCFLFCGDFNSFPENAVYRLMTSQLIDEHDADWSSTPGEEIKGVSFSHDLEIGSACGTPNYTNYTVGFNGCLDYIFYQADKFSVEQVVPLPTHEEVTEHEALPSVTFPSDHIALVADLKWHK